MLATAIYMRFCTSLAEFQQRLMCHKTDRHTHKHWHTCTCLYSRPFMFKYMPDDDPVGLKHVAQTIK